MSTTSPLRCLPPSSTRLATANVSRVSIPLGQTVRECRVPSPWSEDRNTPLPYIGYHPIRSLLVNGTSSCLTQTPVNNCSCTHHGNVIVQEYWICKWFSKALEFTTRPLCIVDNTLCIVRWLTAECESIFTLSTKLSGKVYYLSVLSVCVFATGGRRIFVCGSVTTITQNCVHRSSPNWVCR